MKLVVAVDKEWGIGYKGELLARVRADLRYFQSLTKGNVVVLGSKTLATFPGGKVLKDRTNLVFSRNPSYSPDGAIVIASLDELFEKLKDFKDDSVFVIGGSQIYSLLLPYCDTAYVTKFNKSFEKDAYFENLDDSSEWELVSEGEPQITDPATDTEPSMSFTFCTYRRKTV